MDTAGSATAAHELQLLQEQWKDMESVATQHEAATIRRATASLASAIDRLGIDTTRTDASNSVISAIAARTRDAMRAGASDRPAFAEQVAEGADMICVNRSPAHIDSGLEEMGRSYSMESRHQLRLMWSFNVASLLLAMAVPAVGVFMTRSTLDIQSTWITIVMIVTLAVASAAAAWQGRECRRSSAESRRVGRQTTFLDRYLEPLPKSAQDLLRSVMIQRLYPRLLDDDVLLRDEEAFPTTDQLMEALLPEWDELSAALTKPQSPANEPEVG